MAKAAVKKAPPAPPESPIQQTIFSVGCTIEAMHMALTEQLSNNGVQNPAEVALETLKQGFTNAALSIQILNSIQMNKESAKIGFNRG